MIKRFRTGLLFVIVGCLCACLLAGCSSETYEPQAKTPTISAPIISQDGVLRVGVNANSTPFAGASDTSGIVGINVDIAAAIADELGLKLEVVDVGTDPETALEEGRIDIAMGIDKSDNTLSIWSSEAYIQSAVALFAASPETAVPTQETAPKIAAQTSSMSAWEVNKQFGQDALVASQDLKTAFSDLENGIVNYVAADAVIGSFAANKDSGQAASIVALLQKPSGYGVGVLDSNADLKQIISDTLLKLEGNGLLGLIEIKWLGQPIDLSQLPLTEGAQAVAPTAEEGGEEGEGAEPNEDDPETETAANGEAGSNAVTGV